MVGEEKLPAAMEEGEDATKAVRLQEAPSFGRDVHTLTLQQPIHLHLTFKVGL